MEDQEDKVRKDRALRFLDALTDYYRLRPKLVLGLIHDIANDLVDTVNAKEDLKKELGYFVGQFKILANMLWYHDNLNIVQKAIANSQTLEDIIEAIILSAQAYIMLHGNEPANVSYLANLLDDASASLYRFIENILLDADSKS